MNPSGLRPLGNAVLVEPYDPEIRAGRFILPPSARERMASAEQRATVIEVGPEAWSKEQHPRAAPGDKVMISAYAGTMCVGPLDGKQYRVVNANDIFLGIAGEALTSDLLPRSREISATAQDEYTDSLTQPPQRDMILDKESDDERRIS